MTAAPLCPQCSNELPKGASFCPTCGTATPTTLTGGAGVSYHPPRPDAEQEQRAELQAALGSQYELRALLGRGGFAEVYEAWDTSLKRTVAVKTLRKDIAPSPELLERFRREAEAIATLRHPHIIPIYAVGGNERRAFFIMPKVDGESLGDALRREARIPIVDACRILREAADALSTAHRAGILHRDIKPENIMLDGPARRVLMMDFGIAKGVSAGTSELTGTGTVVGTPHYMSPEQASGERTLDARSDQYALGVVAFRMLSGELPFDGDSLQSVIMKQITAPARPVGELAPEVPPALAAVIDRALAKKPVDRFASLDEFSEAIRLVERDLDIGGERRERITSFKERVALMHSRLPGWKHPLVILAAVAFIAAGFLKVRALVPYAYAQVTERESAQYAAQDLLAKRGVSGPFNTRMTFGSDTLNYEFLQPIIGRDSVEKFAAKYAGLWHWGATFRRKADGTVWRVTVGSDSVIHAWMQLLADSARAPSLDAATAESLAVAELRSRGIDPATMTRREDSTTTRANRTDRLLRWRHAGAPFVSAEHDTAWVETRVRVSGDKVTAFWLAELVVPPQFAQRLASTGSVMAIGFSVILVGFGFVGVLIWLVSGPMRRDPPDWKLGISVACATALLTAPDFVLSTLLPPFLIRVPSTQSIGVQLAIPFILMALLLGAVLVGYVSAGFLSSRQTSSDFTGIGDLAKGRLRAPELASAAAVGGIAGAFLALLQPVLQISLPASMIGTAGGGLPSTMTSAIPAFDVLAMAGASLVVMLYLATGQSLVFRWTRKATLAISVPAAAMLLFVVSTPGEAMGERIEAVIGLVTLGVLTWRFGVLTAAMAFFVSENGSEVIALLLHPSGPPISAMFALLALIAPFGFAMAAYKKVTAVKLRS